MKTILITLTSFFCSFYYAQSFTKDDMALIKPLIQKGAKAKYDEHEGVLWIKSKVIDIMKPSTFSPNGAKMSIYFGFKKTNDKITVLPMRIVNELYLTDWLFFEEIDILYGTLKEKKEGTRLQYSMGAGTTVRTVLGSTYVTEKSDVKINDSMIELLNNMVLNPKSLSIRYSSDKTYIEKFYALGLKAFKKKFNPVLSTYKKAIEKFNITE